MNASGSAGKVKRFRPSPCRSLAAHPHNFLHRYFNLNSMGSHLVRVIHKSNPSIGPQNKTITGYKPFKDSGNKSSRSFGHIFFFYLLTKLSIGVNPISSSVQYLIFKNEPSYIVATKYIYKHFV